MHFFTIFKPSKNAIHRILPPNLPHLHLHLHPCNSPSPPVRAASPSPNTNLGKTHPGHPPNLTSHKPTPPWGLAGHHMNQTRSQPASQPASNQPIHRISPWNVGSPAYRQTTHRPARTKRIMAYTLLPGILPFQVTAGTVRSIARYSTVRYGTTCRSRLSFPRRERAARPNTTPQWHRTTPHAHGPHPPMRRDATRGARAGRFISRGNKVSFRRDAMRCAAKRAETKTRRDGTGRGFLVLVGRQAGLQTHYLPTGRASHRIVLANSNNNYVLYNVYSTHRRVTYYDYCINITSHCQPQPTARPTAGRGARPDRGCGEQGTRASADETRTAIIVTGVGLAWRAVVRKQSGGSEEERERICIRSVSGSRGGRIRGGTSWRREGGDALVPYCT